MPSGEPNVDAPEFYWAGQYDAQTIADSIGMSWTAPLFALNQPRVINVADLCAAPAPSAPEFTTTDLVTGLNPFADNTAIRQKLADFVDAGLWRTFCHAADDPEPDPLPPQPPPADLPPNPPPETDEKLWREQMYVWMQFVVQHLMPRGFTVNDPETVSGTGHIECTADGAGPWTIYAVGADIVITEKPGYAGRSHGGDFPVHYDLGWLSLDTMGGGQSPVRLAHTHQILGLSTPRVDGLYYNLPPGVTIEVRWIFPVTPFGGGGG